MEQSPERRKHFHPLRESKKDPFIDAARTIRAILEERAQIKPLSQEKEIRNIQGSLWHGHSYIYEVSLSRASMNKESSVVWVTLWVPSAREEEKKDYPDIQMTMATTKGEMPLSDDPDVIEEVFRTLLNNLQQEN